MIICIIALRFVIITKYTYFISPHYYLNCTSKLLKYYPDLNPIVREDFDFVFVVWSSFCGNKNKSASTLLSSLPKLLMIGYS